MIYNYIWFLFLGLYLSLSAYHIMVWFGRKEDLLNLFFFILLLCFSYLLSVKGILPIFTNNNYFLFNLHTILINIVPVIPIIGIILFTYYVFDIKKYKKILIIGFIFMVCIPAIISYIVYIVTENEALSNIFIAIPALIFGIIYLILIMINYLSKKESNYRSYWRASIFFGFISFYICYLAYPFLVLFEISNIIQLLTLNIGMLIMSAFSAYALTYNFNQDHYALQHLTNTLEQKVLDRNNSLSWQINRKQKPLSTSLMR